MNDKMAKFGLELLASDYAAYSLSRDHRLTPDERSPKGEPCFGIGEQEGGTETGLRFCSRSLWKNVNAVFCVFYMIPLYKHE
jgi:hypothetical protein